MTDQNITVSTPDPTTQTLVLTVLRQLLTIAGAVGMTTPAWANNATLPVVAGAIATLIGVGWSIWEKYQAKRADHANSVASAAAGKPVQVVKLLAVFIAASLALSACQNPPVISGAPPVTVPVPVVTVPSKVQSACQTVSWAVPLVRALFLNGKLNPTQQNMLAVAQQAVNDCAAGNASASISDIANGLVAILWPPAK